KKALRALLVLQKAHPANFGKSTFAELSAPWSTGIGALHRIALSGVQPALCELLALSLLRQLKSPPSPGALLVLFDAPASSVSPRLQRAVPQDAALALSADHESDLVGKADTELDVLDSDVVVSLLHQAKRRITLRPAFSRFAPPTQS
ncbi:MAG: hypothetical protein Q8P02_01165, partial [Candidatus Micrarchaeota archaeon]|nr:hypothetical protein [Candidatus Micrarchaeota archaeon]